MRQLHIDLPEARGNALGRHIRMMRDIESDHQDAHAGVPEEARGVLDESKAAI